VERGVFCAAPELVFLQMASRLDYDALLFLGCELCGRYGVWENKTVWRDPICDVGQIKDFLAECSGVHGRKKAARALEGVLPGAASPMETGLALCFVLPKAAAGFGLPAPELNHALPVRGAAARLWDWPTITPDLLWDNHKIAIEYDSDGVWLEQGVIYGQGTDSFVIPVIPQRCDHFRVRLSGMGDIKIYSIAKIIEQGSDA
jgi:hypothetical protein